MERSNESRPPKFPLRISATGRYFVDVDGAPVLIQGDAAWSVLVGPTREDAQRYLDDSAAKGFNAIIVNLIEKYFTEDAPRNAYGEEPFDVPGDFATPNEAYMAHAEWVIGEAERRGILVFLVPSYLGYPEPHGYGPQYGFDIPDGWNAEVLANGVDKCRAYGRYLGERFGRFSNIIWTMGGDRDPGAALEHVRAMAAGIGEVDDSHLFSAHVLPESSPFEQYPADPWLAIDFTYSYHIVHAQLMKHYLRAPARPNIMIESTYEYDHNASDVQIRRQAYWSILCGGAGQFMGSRGMWNFAPDWQAMLDSPGRVAQSHLHKLFARHPWWELVPDLSRADEYVPWRDASLSPFITAGVGELRGLDFASAARTADGRLAIVYLPTPRPITVDLTQMSGGSVSVAWFDPITGSDIRGEDRATTPGAEFIPPSDQDWILVITRSADPEGPSA